jgi:hypothetical protein
MRFFLFLSFSIFSFGQDPSTLHPFTDINGRTLQAKLIEAGAESVKVEWNGQTFDLPLDSLDLTTRNLVRRLTRSTPTKGSSDIHDWTDTQGRNIKAKFVKADQTSLTLDWNGKVTTLPLSMFSESSRKLAAKLQSEKTPAPVAVPGQPSPKIDLKGNLDLGREYPWQNTAGRVASGLFISLGPVRLRFQ